MRVGRGPPCKLFPFCAYASRSKDIHLEGLCLLGDSWLLHDPEQGETYSEIDIIEGISLNTQNEISLYTSSSPCNMQANSMTGTARYTDCYRSEEDMDGAVEGCGVEAPSGSFGDASNENGGQVWALLLDDQGVKAWYFEKNKVPADINDGKPNIESWGTPVLDFGAGNCNVKEAWKKLKIVSVTS